MRKEYSLYPENSFPGNGKSKQTEDEKKIAELEASLRRKEQELEILKTHSASFPRATVNFSLHKGSGK